MHVSGNLNGHGSPTGPVGGLLPRHNIPTFRSPSLFTGHEANSEGSALSRRVAANITQACSRRGLLPLSTHISRITRLRCEEWLAHIRVDKPSSNTRLDLLTTLASSVRQNLISLTAHCCHTIRPSQPNGERSSIGCRLPGNERFHRTMVDTCSMHSVCTHGHTGWSILHSRYNRPHRKWNCAGWCRAWLWSAFAIKETVLSIAKCSYCIVMNWIDVEVAKHQPKMMDAIQLLPVCIHDCGSDWLTHFRYNRWPAASDLTVYWIHREANWDVLLLVQSNN